MFFDLALQKWKWDFQDSSIWSSFLFLPVNTHHKIMVVINKNRSIYHDTDLEEWRKELMQVELWRDGCDHDLDEKFAA